ncbi:short-chain dehydrogenase/reductase-like protein sdr [Amylocarpus encephaloides]|uniref:Short-chain dehydrogenase/reductase-like protein sdr n=1 Tax=Amylocarpus encephaloides TaxID=45428 RepID=A0A9P8C8A2_9HELO|nr:short-chain dehydrogenase/reductase-like protein sdr [Amylocarpus encephaloides]
MPYSLKGRNVLVTGGSRGLGARICVKFADEGANVAVNYAHGEERAREVVGRIETIGKGKGVLMRGDMGLEEDCISVVEETIKQLGGIDIIISNAGYTRFSTYSDLSTPTVSDWDLCHAINIKAPFFLLRQAMPHFKANPEGGAFIVTSSIAAVKNGGSCLPYSVSKAAQLHFVRGMAGSQGVKLRINAVLPGWLRTEWGEKYTPEQVEEMNKIAWLGKPTDLDDCAQTFIDIAKNSSMTGQKIQVDSGLGHD